MNLQFQWNKSRAKDDNVKHGVTFELATSVFNDPFAIKFLDIARTITKNIS